MQITAILVLACSTYALVAGQQCANTINNMMGCMKQGVEDQDLKARCDRINTQAVHRCFTDAGCVEPTMEAMIKKKMDEKLSNSPFGGMAKMMMSRMESMKPDVEKMKECGKKMMPEVHSCMSREVSWMNSVNKPDPEEMEEKMEHIKKIMKSKMIKKACNSPQEADQVTQCLQSSDQTNIIALRQAVCSIGFECKNRNGELPESCKEDMKRAGCVCGKEVMPSMLETCDAFPEEAKPMIKCVMNAKSNKPCDAGSDGGPMAKMSPEKMMERMCSDNDDDDDDMDGGFMPAPGKDGPPPEMRQCMMTMMASQGPASDSGNQGPGGFLSGLFGGQGNRNGGGDLAGRLFGNNAAPQASNSNGPPSFFKNFFNRGNN